MSSRLSVKAYFLEALQKNIIYRYYRYALKPNIKLIKKLKTQLFSSTNLKNSSRDQKKILVPLIETSHPIFYVILIISKFLSLRGADVRILICGSHLPGCEIKSVRSPSVNPCLACKANVKRILPLFNLKVQSISDYLAPELIQLLQPKTEELFSSSEEMVYKGISIETMVNDSFVRHFYGATPDEGTVLFRNTRLRYIFSAIIGIEVAAKIHETWNPDIIFGTMNVYVDYAPYYDYFLSLEKETSLIAMTPFNFNSVILNSPDLYTSSLRFNTWLNKRKNKSLDRIERNELQIFLNSRFQGTTRIFKEMQYFSSDLFSFESSQKLYDRDSNQSNVVLFPNIYWDIGLSECNTIFDDVVSWVIETVSIISSHPNINLFIKPHPAEMYDSSPSSKGIESFVRQAFPHLSNNINFTPPQMKVNSYDLIPYVDYAITYNGTIGLEYMLKGIPVITAGVAPYSNMHLSNDPSSKIEYKQLITGKVELQCPEQSKLELFAYFYFIKACIPFDLIDQVFGNDFNGYAFKSLDDLTKGQNRTLQHISDCILDKTNHYPEDYLELNQES